MKKLLLLFALCLPSFAVTNNGNYDTLQDHASRTTRAKGTYPGTGKYDANGWLWIANRDTADTVTSLLEWARIHPLPAVKQGTGITVTQSTDTFTVSLYAPPIISALSNTSPTNYAGQTVTVVTVNWTWGGSPITSQTLTDCTPALADRTDRKSVV